MQIQLFDFFSEIIKSIPHIRTDGGIDFLQAVDLGVSAVIKPACYAFGLDFILNGDFGKELSKLVFAAVIVIIPKRIRRIGTPRRVRHCLII